MSGPQAFPGPAEAGEEAHLASAGEAAAGTPLMANPPAADDRPTGEQQTVREEDSEQKHVAASTGYTPADVKYFAQSLQSWFDRNTESCQLPSAGPPQMLRQRSGRLSTSGVSPGIGLGGKSPAAAAARARRQQRVIPFQLSAPAGGSLAMQRAAEASAAAATAAAAAKKAAFAADSAAAAAAAQQGSAVSDGATAAGFDYSGLRQQLQGLAKEVLVELWIEEHQRLVAAGLMEDAEAAFRSVLERVAQQQKLAVHPPSKREELTGIDLILRDGLLAFLLKVSEYLPHLPTKVVKLKGVTHTVKVQRMAEGYETVGSKLLGCFMPCLKPAAPVVDFDVLHDFSGFLMPGSITLVCGPPGCGKSAVHKLVAGRLVPGQQKGLTGDVTYNNVPLEQLKARRLAAFVGQTDQHFADLTVLETCKFAQDCNRLFTPDDHSPLGDLLKMVKEEFGGIDLKLDFTLHLLGLRNAANTIVGSRTKRGISGGERHRVTTAEMLSGVFIVFCFDEISTGLDSSATYDIVSALRTMARVRRLTCLFSLLQPSPDVFNLFDRLIVLSEGNVIYQGPRSDVLPYFEALGYHKPPHVDTADFIQEIPTDSGMEFVKQGGKPLSTQELVDAYKSSAYYKEVMRIVDCQEVKEVLWTEAPPPLGLTFREGSDPGTVEVASVAKEGPMAEADIAFTAQIAPGDRVTGVEDVAEGCMRFLAVDGGGGKTGGEGAGSVLATVGAAAAGTCGVEGRNGAVPLVRLQLERPLKEEEAPSFAKWEQEYARAWWPSTKLVVKRQLMLQLRNITYLVARMMQVLVLGIFSGTVFFQIPSDGNVQDMSLRLSVNFLTIMTLALGSFALIPNIMDERVIVAKQMDARFYRPTSYVIAGTLSQLPFVVAEVLVFTPLIYWLTGMSAADNGVHFLLFVLVGLLADIMGSSLIRLISSISPTKEGASGLAGLSVISFLLFTGFLMPKNNIPAWWIWLYYANPLQYAVTALCVNEMLSGSYDAPCSSVSPSVAPYCSGVSGDTSIGVAFLAFFQLPTSFFIGVWVSILAIIGFTALFTALTFIAVKNLRLSEKQVPADDRLQPLSADEMKTPLEKALKPIMNQRGKSKDAADEAREDGGTGGTGRKGEDGGLLEGEDTAVKAEAGGHRGAGDHSGMSFVPSTLSFHDLVYEVDVPGVRDPRVLLNSISGYVKPGTMTALMGSSGAGKTTLLDVLAGRKTMGRIRGEILINGYPKVQETFARIAGYVEQNDIHTPFITVRESLEFSAALRLPKSTTKAQRKAAVDEAMDLLELNPISTKLVGFIGVDGLTVEQAKRLTIGVELVSNPAILFLDEPTSGLDSRAAQIVVRGMQNVASTGRSIICTIHQPSRRLFFAFENLYLMKRGGEVVYFGPIGANGSSLVSYFESIPGVPKCRDDQNPATYMLEIIGAGIGHAMMRDFALDYSESELAAVNQEELDALRFGKGDYGAEPTLRGYAASPSTMMYIVVRRQFRTYWRNVSYSFGRMVLAIILGLLLGSAFWQITWTTIPGESSRQGLIYISLVFIAIVNANSIIPQVNAERPVYYRESASNMYPAFFYDFSWGIVEIPYLAMSTLIFCSICFSMAGVATNSAADFFLFWFIFFLYTATITFFGILMAMLTPNAETATIIIPVIVSIWNITSGFMIPKDSIPQFWIWVYWLNPTQYALKGLLSIAFYCDTSDGSPCSGPQCPTNPAACPSCTCPRLTDSGNQLTWTVVQQQRALDRSTVWVNILALLVFVVVFRFGAYLALRFMRYNKR